MPIHRPLSVLIKPSSSRCNLRCAYCFYLAKQAIYPWKDNPKLSIETFTDFCEQYAQLSAPHFSINWQGGEPTLMGLDFFREAVDVEARTLGTAGSGRAVQITNALQTNGTLLDDEWARFLRDHQFLVGISLDGPPEWHDHYRFDARQGTTHERVMQAIDLLRTYNVEFNVLTVVSQRNVEHPRELLRYLVDLDLRHLQFIPCVERLPADHPHASEITDYSITPEQYGQFLTEQFNEWLRIGYHQVRIRYFDNLIQMALGIPAEMCQLARTCGSYVVLEHNGDVYPCDFFVEPDWKLGNIHETPLAELASGEQLRQFGQAKAELPDECGRCQWRPLCHGECPRYRITNAGTHRERTYFCSSYKAFFAASWPRLGQVATEVSRVRSVQSGDLPLAAAAVSRRLEQRPTPASVSPGQVRAADGQYKVGRNEPCPCGSGRKYKRCHGA